MKIKKYLPLLLCVPLLLGCGIRMVENLNSMPPQQLTQVSDQDMCQARKIYTTAFGAPDPSQDFITEFNRRGIVCDESGLYTRVVYTQNRIDAEDEAWCVKLGVKVGTTEYAQCRMQIRSQRTQINQREREMEAQQRASGFQNLSATGNALMKSSGSTPQIKSTFCTEGNNSLSCVTQ